jgi:sulfatase maturation enzyme AslB (radical SAM superfamily)
MCPRRINGGIINPFIDLHEITLEQFKVWFSEDFIKQLDNLFMCGDLGDPIIAKDTLEIFQYLRKVNPTISLSMHTNGSARTSAWWQELAKANVRVIFGIDGLADTHSLYRVNTDWNSIIKNATTFIQEGGIAEWHMLVFKHNEHQVDDCRQLSSDLGFHNFESKHTVRFMKNKFHVLDDEGKTTHIIYPTEKSQTMISIIQHALLNDIKSNSISCKAKQYNQIYVSAAGNVSPCCWLDFQWHFSGYDGRIDYMDRINQFPNLNETTLLDIFNSCHFDKISDTWNSAPLVECNRQCGNYDQLIEQFD